MGNLNAEAVKKALEWGISEEFCENCLCTVYGKSMTSFLNDVLALINKQETEYNELYELLQTYKADSEAYRSYSKTLEKENEALKTLLDESFEAQNTVKADTVRKMQERLDKRFCHDPAFLGVEQRLIMGVIDQTAKEMLEASSQKEQIVVSDVANAQKQRAEPDESTESRYATMFQEEKDNG